MEAKTKKETKIVKEIKETKEVAKKVTAKQIEKKAKSDTMAVIKTGGKQYVIREGEIIKIEKLDAEDIVDNKVTFEEVLLIDDGKTAKMGDPILKGSKVEAEVIKEVKDKKVTIIRYRQKSRYFKKRGHRQPVVFVRITAIK